MRIDYKTLQAHPGGIATTMRLLILICIAASAYGQTDPAPAPDGCFISLADPAEMAELADRTCSDQIAGLSYLVDPTAADRQALASAYNNRGIARTRLGNLDGASEDFAAALALAPEAWAIYLNRGNLWLARNEPEAALADYQQVAGLAPEPFAATARNRVLAYRALGDTNGATQSLLEAMQVEAMQAPADKPVVQAAPATTEPASARPVDTTPSAADIDVPPASRPR